MNKFNPFGGAFLGNANPTVSTPQPSYQLNVPQLQLTRPLAQLAAGAPIQIIKSNNGVVLIGAAALVIALYVATKP